MGLLAVSILGVHALLQPAGALAATGTLDTTFGSSGYAVTPIGTWSAAAAVAVQPDGKIVTAGESQLNGVDVITATRMTAGGQLDQTFGKRGIVTVAIGGAAGVDSGAGLALQPDGKIVIAGTGEPNGSPTFAVVRLTSTGALDTAFGQCGVATVPIGGAAIANAVAVQPNGQIVVGGTANVSGTNHFAVTRLNANGTLDTTFGTRGVTTLAPAGGAWGMVLQPNGAVVLAGPETYNGTQAYMAARVLANGTLDPSFGQGGIVTTPIGLTATPDAVALQADGKIVITGDATTSTGVVATERLNPDGSLDATFGSGGIASFNGAGVNAVAIDGSGRIVLAGVGAAAVRLDGDGSIDTTFGAGGLAIYQYAGNESAANGLAFDASGRIVLAGAATVNGSPEVLVLRLSA
jgi:uncharacterized delta-60 repeat protein